ncbi:hypothetical protein PARPLA_02562 [Rhodobacteraceae bacterium THAF1]|uniref:antifreeze protein n=1 Tax=Palleronia sp. THAF1 TaxID=2587842 RepID=UPI000F3BD9AC|nr:antifreeze protein [Palleronia sp. THAF1]QFU08042.1 hypothetical protein FIU81_05085 [Palleronia sp. THAF1]VDC27896.1 hypothetical protein PARPLA_02562 [Rhodobacteraceae bacterium THAF1]
MNGYMTTSFAFWRMMTEAQTVIAYRTFGMMGLWAVSPSENDRMVSEKMPAFLAASQAATMAAMTGKSPDKIAAAWLRPIGGKTRANQKRLSKMR